MTNGDNSPVCGTAQLIHQILDRKLKSYQGWPNHPHTSKLRYVGYIESTVRTLPGIS